MKMKKIILIVSAFAVLFALCSCGGKASADAPSSYGTASAGTGKSAAMQSVKSLTLYLGAVELPVGRELKLHAAAQPSDAKFTWKSSDESLLTVGEDGTVTAKAAGETTVTVTAGDKTASCSVRIVSEGPTLLWNGALPPENPPEPPVEPPTDGDAGKAEGEEQEIPVEVPDDVITVEHIPEIDEFNWKIKIDRQYPTTVTNDGMTLDADMHIKLIVEKKGGKTPLGTYEGIFYGDGDLNREKFIAFMNEQLAGTDAEFLDFQETDNAKEVPITLTVEEMDNSAFHKVMYPNYNPETAAEGVTYENYHEWIPFAHFPGTLMAIGEISSPISITYTFTVRAGGVTITTPSSGSNEESVPYRLSIYGDIASIHLPTVEKYGIAECYAKGKLTKTPIIPE